MADTLFRAARAESLSIAFLDSFTLVYHRASGMTHMVTAPAPEILATLGEAGMTLMQLQAALAVQFDVADEDEAGLAARLDELVVAGLIEVGLVEVA